MTARAPSILVSPVSPNPDGSGLEQRAFALLHDLADRFEVTLIVASENATPSGTPPAVQSLTAAVHHLRTCPTSAWGRRAVLCFPPLVLIQPNWTTDWQQPAEPPPALPPHPAHVAFFRLRTHPLRTAIFPFGLPCPTLMDLDDLESKTLWSIGGFAMRRLRLRLAHKHLAMALQYALLERTLLHHYDRVSYASPADAKVLAGVSGSPTLLWRPNRVQLTRPRARPAPEAPFTLLFLGTLGYFPNEDAVLWLAEELVPALRRQGQLFFRLLIAGRGASPRLIGRLARVPEIEFLGPVEQVAPLYAQSHIAVAAVRCGGGTKVKVLEAVAHHCPVVATPHSTLGLPFVAGEDLLEATHSEAFAGLCVHLARNPAEANAMAESAYRRLTASSSNAAIESTSKPSTSC